MRVKLKKPNLEKLFKAVSKKNIIASSKKLVRFLNKQGMPIGNKITQGLKIPNWVLEKSDFQKSYIHGLSDTDGSIYEDRHYSSKKPTYMADRQLQVMLIH